MVFSSTHHHRDRSGGGPFAHLVVPPVITIDGGAGTGKSSIASMLSKRLGDLPLLDSGLWYRALGLASQELLISTNDAAAMVAFTRSVSFLRPGIEPDGVVTLLQHGEGTKVRRFSFTAEQLGSVVAGQRGSEVAIYPGVRSCLLEAQREIGRGGCVAAGRAQGAEIFGEDYQQVGCSQAVLRVLLHADLVVRAARRVQQLPQSEVRGVADISVVREDLKIRDDRDMSREIARLLSPEEASAQGYLVVDTTSITREQVSEVVIHEMKARGLVRE